MAMVYRGFIRVLVRTVMACTDTEDLNLASLTLSQYKHNDKTSQPIILTNISLGSTNTHTYTSSMLCTDN